jgi:hypothetical protein
VQRLLVRLVVGAVALVAVFIVGHLWLRGWVMRGAYGLTGGEPHAMALTGWATMAWVPLFGIVLVSGTRRSRAWRRGRWVLGVLALVFLPTKRDPLIHVAFDHASPYRAFAVGYLAAVLAFLAVALAALPTVPFGGGRHRARPTGTWSSRWRTRVLVASAVVAPLVAVAIGERLV